jgi:hypothetical protein
VEFYKGDGGPVDSKLNASKHFTIICTWYLGTVSQYTVTDCFHVLQGTLEGKMKVKLSLCLTKHNPMKTYGVEVQLHALTSALGMEVSGQLHASAVLPQWKEPPLPIE